MKGYALAALAITAASAAILTQASAQVPAPSPPGVIRRPVDQPRATEALALPADFPKPKLVTLSVQKAPLREAFQQLQQQTGMTFSAESSRLSDQLSLDVKGMPLWQTVQFMTRAIDPAGKAKFNVMVPDSGGNSRTVPLGHYVSAAGPFLVIASRVTHEAAYWRDDRNIERVCVEVGVLSDGGVSLGGVAGITRASRAIDASANILPPADLPPLQPSFQSGSILMPCQIMIGAPSASASRDAGPPTIKLLEGSISGDIVLKTEKLQCDLPGTTQMQIDDVTITLTAVDNGNSERVELRITGQQSMTDAEWNVFLRRFGGLRIQALDAAGKEGRINNSGGGSGTRVRIIIMQINKSAPNGNEATAPGAPVAGPAVKASVDIPTEIRTIEIPYRFEDLPLP